MQSFKILTYEMELFFENVFIVVLSLFCIFLSFFLSSTQILLTVIFLVFISKLYSSQFPAAES